MHIPKKQENNPIVRVQMYPFSHDVHDEQSCMVRTATHGSGDQKWQIFAFGQVMSQRKDPLKPLITMFGHVHSRVREMMRINDAIDPEFVFDEVLTSYNDQWKGLFKKHDVHYLLKSSYVIGVIKGGRMCVADRGMCVGKMVTEIEGQNKVIPVLTARTESTSTSLFESIVCGALPRSSRIALGTSQLRAVGRNDVFVQLLSKRTTTLEIIWQRMIKKLRQADDPPVAGVLLESYTGATPSGKQEIPRQRFSEYMQYPPESHTVILTGFGHRIFGVAQRLGMGVSFLITRVRILFDAIVKRLPSWMRMPKPLRKAVKVSGKSVKSTYRTMARHEASRTIMKSGRTFVTGSVRGLLLALLWLVTNIFRPLRLLTAWLWRQFVRLHMVQKVALIGVIVAIVGISFGVHITRVREQNVIIAEQNAKLRDRFIEQHQIAESKLVFGNIPEAKEALAEAETALSSLMQAGEDVSLEQQQLQAVRNELLKEKEIELSVVSYTHEGTPMNGLITSGGRMYAWNDTILVDVLSEREIELSRPLTSSSVITAVDDGIVFITDSSMQYFGNDQSLEVGELNISGLNNLSAAHVYGGRLYSLDGAGQIFKHGESSNGFSKGAIWSEQITENPIDIAIDGHIYTLSSEGSIFKHFKGKRIPYNHSSIDPPLSKPTQMWTDGDAEYVYVLEPARRRLVKLGKTGLMEVQYIFDKPAEAFAINEKEKHGYVLIGAVVYRFGL